MMRTLHVLDAPRQVRLTGASGRLGAGHLVDFAAVPGANACATTAAGPTAAVPERALFQGAAAVESVVRVRVA
jgi:hypothetical protein